MSQELIYTSAPRGLKPGSQGFCTVVSTTGIATSLIQRLEALSGYRHVYSPQDPNARLNPVLCSHLLLDVGGRPYHVLSRICDAGLDYTQRNNKFAHHVVLDRSELAPGGPAWLLSLPGFMQAAWDGEPKVLPAGRRAPAGDSPLAVCRAWQRVAGDAGWGGVLAETASGGAARPAVLIFRPGMDPLPLLLESLALLPPQARWGVSFSTYFNKLPPGVDCQWRCVLEGSPDAAAARRLSGATIIDLCCPQKAAAGGRYVEAARTGIAPPAAASGTRPALLPGASRPSDDELARLLTGSASVSAVPTVTAPAPPAEYSLADYGLAPPPIAGRPPASAAPPVMRKFKRKRKSKLLLIGTLSAVAIVLIAAIGILLVENSRQSARLTLQTSQDGAEKGAKAKADKEAKDKADKEAKQRADKEGKAKADKEAKDKADKEAKQRADKEAIDKADKEAKDKADKEAIDKADKEAKDKADKEASDKAEAAKQARAALAKFPRSIAFPDYLEPKGMDKYPIAMVPWIDAKDYDLDLLGKDEVLPKGYRLVVERGQIANDTPGWFCSLRSPASAGSTTTLHIGQFFIEKGELFVQWRSDASSERHSGLMRNCLLQVSPTNSNCEPRCVCLRTPEKAEALKFQMSSDRGACRSKREFSLKSVPEGMTPEFEVFNNKDLPQPTRLERNKAESNMWSLKIGEAMPLRFDVSGRTCSGDKFEVILVYKGVPLEGDEWNKLPARLLSNGLALLDDGAIKKHLADLDAILKGKPAVRGKLPVKGIQTVLNEAQSKLRDARGDRPDLVREVEQLKRKIEENSKQTEEVELLAKRFDKVKNHTVLHYRIFVMIAGHEVDLFTTDPH